MAAPTDYSAYWKFDGTLTDEVASNDFSGTIVGYVDGSIGQAVNIGSNNLDAGDITAAEPGTGSFSLAGHLYINAQPGANLNFYDKKSSQIAASTVGWYLGVNASNKWIFTAADGTNRTRWTSDSATVSAGSFQHVAFVWDATANTFTLYIDASTVALTQDLDSPSLLGDIAGTSDFILRGSGTALPRHDDLRLYKRALTATEVGDIYTAGQEGSSGSFGLSYDLSWSLLNNLSTSLNSLPLSEV